MLMGIMSMSRRDPSDVMGVRQNGEWTNGDAGELCNGAVCYLWQ